MRIVFVGTPDFSVPTLAGLLDAGHEVVLVVTQPDRPSGRGRKMCSSPVKTFALERGLPVFQPDDINVPESLSVIAEKAPDTVVVIAFGQKLSPELLRIPSRGCYNVHGSLLPAYRGAAPTNWVIINGEKETGITIIRMAEKIDAGEMLANRVVSIAPDWTAGDLSEKLSRVGAELMVDVLEQVAAGTDHTIRQDSTKVTHARKLTKNDGLIPWEKSATDVHNHIRGMTPWPGAFSFLTGDECGSTRVVVLKTRVLESDGCAGAPGEIIGCDDAGMKVACVEGVLLIEQVKPAGKRAMSADDCWRGRKAGTSMRFENHE